MKRIVIHQPGGYRRLCIETHPDPVPATGEVLIDVQACGVNFADCVTRMGLYASARHYVGFPVTPGFEVAGRVLACGAGCDDLPVNTPVFAVTRFNGYSTRLCVPRAQVFGLPASMTPAEAAGFPAVALTAWYALFRLAQPEPGARLLVHSAAGGVGGMLVQLGRLAGCHVTGVVGAAHKRPHVESLGATEVIDKSTQAPWPAAERIAADGFDVIFDANGATTLRDSYRHLAPTGRLVVYGFHSMLVTRNGKPDRLRLAFDWLRTPRFSPFDLTTRNRGVLGFNLSFLFDRTALLAQGMQQLLGWHQQDRLRLLPVTTFPFERVADAHRALESGRTIGKLVLLT